MSAGPYDLTTLAAVKATASIAGTADDTVLQRMITAMSLAAQQYMSRIISVQPYTERRNGTGSRTMALGDSPLVQMNSVVVAGVSIPVSPDGIQAGYITDDFAIYLFGYTFCKGLKNTVLNYTAGWQTTPPDIEQGVIESVLLRFNEKNRIGVSSKTLGPETISFSQKDFTNSASTIFDQYKRRFTPA